MRGLNVIALFAVAAGAHAQWMVTNLHPAGAASSQVFGVWSAQQGGRVIDNGVHASLWNGSAASWVDLTPAGSGAAQIQGVQSGHQVGWANFGGATRASLWSGSAISWVDLHPAGAQSSIAFGVGGGQQVGSVDIGAGGQLRRASLWAGSAASWVNLHPEGQAGHSAAYGVDGAQQVGIAVVPENGPLHASLWSGSAASWVDLHPASASSSWADEVHDGQQVGFADVPGTGDVASLWTDTAESWVNLNPAGATQSQARGVYDGQQVGYSSVGGSWRASLWSGTASSWVDLGAFIPAEFTHSYALDIWNDGMFIYVGGYGFNSATNREEALLWVAPIPQVVLPDSFSLFRGMLIVGGLSELLASDDARMIVRPGITLSNAERQVQLILTGTAPTETPTELRFRVEAHASINNIGQWIELWNYDTASWEQVDFMIATTVDSIVEVSITTDPGRFVQAGTRQMKAKISYKEAGIVLQYPWLIFFDQTVWVIVP